jgi:hypothetical protein
MQSEQSNNTESSTQQQTQQSTQQSTQSQYYYQVNFSTKPTPLLTTTQNEFGFFTPKQTNYMQLRMGPNFVKMLQWSPDGTCLLSSSEDFRLKLFEL